MAHVPKGKTTVRKYRAIQARYKELTGQPETNSDVAIRQIMTEFFITLPETVTRIITTQLNDE